MDENTRALMEGACAAAEDEYFSARPQIDCTDRRRVFQAGFQRAWKAATEAAAKRFEGEVSRLRERCHPSKVVMIGDTGHYVSEVVGAEIERLRDALQSIQDMTDADNPDSYRCDDREGCLDTVYATATEAIEPPTHPN